ncbi:deacylase, partial [Oxalobacteraceae bacterium OM1]
PQLKETLRDRLGPDADANVSVVRIEALRLLDGWQPLTETEAMKKTLLTLAVDADVALDLHCDHEAMMHVYTGTPLVDRAKPLTQLLGAHAVLTARESGDDPFDEACSRTWWELAEHFGPAFPIPCACFSATVELRGELDVRHDYAERDADALLGFLTHEGFIRGEPPALPAPLCEATPLEGVEPIAVPHGGLLVFVRDIGEQVDRGTVIAELIDPISGEVTPLRTTVTGMFFARTRARFVQRGMRIAKVAGAVPFRTGKLMGE